VPLEFLMDPTHHERRIVTLGDMTRTFYAMPYEARRRYFIWGGDCGGMLRQSLPVFPARLIGRASPLQSGWRREPQWPALAS